MRKKEERFCDVCGVSSLVKKVSSLKGTDMCLCEKHKAQYKKYGEFKDSNPRGVFDPNEVRTNGKVSEIDTYDQYGNVMETFIIDSEDIEKLGDRKWRCVYKNDKPYLFTGNQKSEKIYFHRLVMPTDKQVDHISGNTLDNRKANLREVSIQNNMKNLQKKNTNTSGIRGVSYDKKRNLWKTDFTCEKIRYYVKDWSKKEQAVYQRYILEKYFLKEYRNTANDELFLEYISKLSNAEKREIKDYLISKLNISKDRVEEI